MSEMIIRIKDNGEVAVEESVNNIKSYKRIEPDDLIKCISGSLIQGISSGLLPSGCLSYSQGNDNGKGIILMFPENRADISYYGTVYSDFPLPKLVFGFRVSPEGRVNSCSLCVTANDEVLKPDSKMFHYPLSNVNGFHLCTGNNPLPKCTSLHTLGSLPYYIMSMPNNNDYFRARCNRPGLEMRELLELLKDKEPEYYYSNILVPYNDMTLKDFIAQGA